MFGCDCKDTFCCGTDFQATSMQRKLVSAFSFTETTFPIKQMTDRKTGWVEEL